MTRKLKKLLKGSEPIRLTVGYLKGGTGKSTTAVYLALTLARYSDKPVLLIDADTVNQSTLDWATIAGAEWPANVQVRYWPGDLAQHIADSGHDGHIVIDTGPGSIDIFTEALTVTDLLVTPVAATPTEISRLRTTLSTAAQIATQQELDHAVVFTRTQPRTVSYRDARESLAEHGIAVLGTGVPFKLQYSQSFGTVPNDLGTYPDILTELLTIKGQK